MLKIKRPNQLANLLEVIKNCIAEGRYRHTVHALQRAGLRQVDLPDVLYVLKNGYHEKRKTSFDEAFQNWKYAIRGRTLDGDEIRIIVTIPKEEMLIITVINLSLGKEL